MFGYIVKSKKENYGNDDREPIPCKNGKSNYPQNIAEIVDVSGIFEKTFRIYFILVSRIVNNNFLRNAFIILSV
jgi:hypothetical protein